MRFPREANKCVAYLPANYDPRRTYGLFVSLHPPGEFDTDATIDRWDEVCQANDLILLLPQSDDTSRWLPTEESFIRKTIDEALNRFPIDPTRIVIHGYQAGGAMAYLVAFKHRDVVRGVVAIDAALPLRMARPDNDPVQRLAIVTGAPEKSRLHGRIVSGIEALRERKFPVTVFQLGPEPRPLDADELGELGRWVDSLDRI